MRLNYDDVNQLNPRIRGQVEAQLGEQEKKKGSKYKNVSIKVNDERFDSMAEHQRYEELVMMLRAKEITDLRRQVPYPVGGDVHYVADFVYFDFQKKTYVVEDVKGMLTDVYKVKRRLFYEKYGFEITEV